MSERSPRIRVSSSAHKMLQACCQSSFTMQVVLRGFLCSFIFCTKHAAGMLSAVFYKCRLCVLRGFLLRNAEGETVTSLSVEASKKALEMANVNPEDIDLLLLCTSTPDDLFGSAPQVNSIRQDGSQASDDTWTGEGGCEKNVCHLLKILWGSIACMHGTSHILLPSNVFTLPLLFCLLCISLCVDVAGAEGAGML